MNTNKELKLILDKPPKKMMERLDEYKLSIQKMIDICDWKPQPTPYDCDDLCSVEKAKANTEDILNSFNVHQ